MVLVQPSCPDIESGLVLISCVKLRAAFTTKALQANIAAVRCLCIFTRRAGQLHVITAGNHHRTKGGTAELLAIAAVAGDHPRVFNQGCNADGTAMACACYIYHLCHPGSPLYQRFDWRAEYAHW